MKRARKLKVEYEFIPGEGNQQRVNEVFRMLFEKIAKNSPNRNQFLYLPDRD